MDGQIEQKRSAATSWLALFAGTSTLLCCALPAMLVTLGAGASLATLVSVFPQIVWLSEHSAWVFCIGAVMLLLGGAAQWQQRHAPCPLDPGLRQACMAQRRRSVRIYGVSVLLFAVGSWFAFIQPWWSGG
ncbi:hypothetical protein EYS42_10475 [Aquabacterium lacunae]|uniref:Mercuric transport protein MerT n=1 Tax=Aquabacterium lacunae TaxID=2528630 RepID=A0A4Q9GXW4_9BURK|nr:hypothetical protein EYS42_10475 [Aquabacterium lacunae]